MTEEVENITCKLSELNLPIYYKYRYTFAKDEDTTQDWESKMRCMVNFIINKYLCGDKIVAGVETYTKGMLKCKPHLHIHFMSRHTSDTIRKGLARNFEMIGRCQSCIPEVIVEADGAKFWRYPLKQQKGDSKNLHIVKGFSKSEVEVMIDIANTTWVTSAQVLVNKIEKKLERTSKERLFVYFDKLFEFKSIKQSCIDAYIYFAEHENEVSVKTIDAYVYQYLLLKKYITGDDLYELTH